jgi:hypothetical protein
MKFAVLVKYRSDGSWGVFPYQTRFDALWHANKFSAERRTYPYGDRMNETVVSVKVVKLIKTVEAWG